MGATTEKKEKPATPPEPKKTEQPETDADSIINQMAEIKAKTVPVEDYEKMKNERDKYRTAVISGALSVDDEPEKSRAELVKEMSGFNSGNVTNLKYIETALKLRERTIAEKGVDPFETNESPDGSGSRVAEGLQKMVEEAAGRPEAFLGIYQSSVRDEKINKPM